MQCSVVKFREVKSITDFRIDAECFKPIHLRTAELISRLPNSTIGQISRSVINFGAYSLCNHIVFLSEGIPFIVTEDIKNNIIDTDDLHYISEEVHQILYKSHCKPGQVLLTMAGAYLGQAAVYYLDFESSSNQAIAKITLRENTVEPLYLSTFLNCRFGQSQIERFSTGTGQPNLNLGLIQTIIIPIASTDFQKYIKELVLQGTKFDSLGRESYKQAKKTLLSELSLVDWKPQRQLSFIKNFSEARSADRIDAEYFQPMYDELIEKIKGYKNGYKTLGECAKIKDKKFMPKADVTYKYIELANISANGNINGFTEATGEELPTRARLKVSTGDVIVSSIEGSLSSIALINADLNNALCSTGFYVVNSDSINSETLLVLLKSPVGQLQLKKGCSGTILTAINNEEFKPIILPDISDDIQKEIKQEISEMYKAKSASKKLLGIAKCAVEMAIEQNEEEATRWLNEEVESKCQITM